MLKIEVVLSIPKLNWFLDFTKAISLFKPVPSQTGRDKSELFIKSKSEKPVRKLYKVIYFKIIINNIEKIGLIL